MANPTNRLAGTAYLSVDGVTYMLAGDFEYKPSLVTRESLTGMDTVHGFSEKPVAPHISCTLRDSGGLSVASLNAMVNVTIVVELANGKTIIGRNMWSVEDQTAKSTDATIDVKWEGQQGAVTEA
ncbi:phage tail protein [Rhodanobacter sp. B04]|uniref:phage tail tube protein n=1 Tax=Rhodanobacter sp. B04 TaxID=1945860 RepID=UPI000985108D|nr:phage tail tube protein [Rhodanobacter sp. B04]OOG61449.1 phage tail protein [Rhodanobacter sp. B04]